jgi:hypothetical protein
MRLRLRRPQELPHKLTFNSTLLFFFFLFLQEREAEDERRMRREIEARFEEASLLKSLGFS